MTEYLMTIDGEQAASNGTLDVVNPATGEVFATAPECTAELLEAAMTSAESAQRTWAVTEESVRRQALRACAGALIESAAEFANVLTTEQGKPLKDAENEVRAAAGWFAYFAEMEIPQEVVHEDDDLRVELSRRPLGVVAAITPWNYPLLLAAWKIAPALLAGNTVILKPSPYTPLTALLLGTRLSAVLPKGTLNVVTGSDVLGPLITEHAIPRKISFTGSTATGRRVAASAAKTLKHVTLELGGNDAAIVLDDVDPEAVIDQLFWASFANNGQTCVAIKRVYVPESRHEQYVDLFANRANAAVVGDGSAPETQLGPLNNQMQRDIVSRMVESAREDGAQVVTGGSAIDGPGYFYAPTIVTNVKDDADIVANEQFGPALPILSYGTVDEALQRANGTPFGLGGSVWGTDLGAAQKVAAGLECGSAWVNTHMALSPKYPFSGAKTSGLGVENGLLGYLSFTEAQTRHLPKN